MLKASSSIRRCDSGEAEGGCNWWSGKCGVASLVGGVWSFLGGEEKISRNHGWLCRQSFESLEGIGAALVRERKRRSERGEVGFISGSGMEEKLICCREEELDRYEESPGGVTVISCSVEAEQTNKRYRPNPLLFGIILETEFPSFLSSKRYLLRDEWKYISQENGRLEVVGRTKERDSLLANSFAGRGL